MSWTCSIPEVPPAELHDAIDAAVPDPPELDAGPKAQFEAAKAAAQQLHEASCVGEGSHMVTVRLAGHAASGPDPSMVSVTLMELVPTLAQSLPDPPAQDAVVHDENGEPIEQAEEPEPSADTAEEPAGEPADAAAAAEGE
jgi:hypothetical protein